MLEEFISQLANNVLIRMTKDTKIAYQVVPEDVDSWTLLTPVKGNGVPYVWPDNIHTNYNDAEAEFIGTCQNYILIPESYQTVLQWYYNPLVDPEDFITGYWWEQKPKKFKVIKIKPLGLRRVTTLLKKQHLVVNVDFVERDDITVFRMSAEVEGLEFPFEWTITDFSKYPTATDLYLAFYIYLERQLA